MLTTTTEAPSKPGGSWAYAPLDRETHLFTNPSEKLIHTHFSLQARLIHTHFSQQARDSFISILASCSIRMANLVLLLRTDEVMGGGGGGEEKRGKMRLFKIIWRYSQIFVCENLCVVWLCVCVANMTYVWVCVSLVWLYVYRSMLNINIWLWMFTTQWFLWLFQLLCHHPHWTSWVSLFFSTVNVHVGILYTFEEENTPSWCLQTKIGFIVKNICEKWVNCKEWVSYLCQLYVYNYKWYTKTTTKHSMTWHAHSVLLCSPKNSGDYLSWWNILYIFKTDFHYESNFNDVGPEPIHQYM